MEAVWFHFGIPPTFGRQRHSLSLSKHHYHHIVHVLLILPAHNQCQSHPKADLNTKNETKRILLCGHLVSLVVNGHRLEAVCRTGGVQVDLR